jgi:hypothetical protein
MLPVRRAACPPAQTLMRGCSPCAGHLAAPTTLLTFTLTLLRPHCPPAPHALCSNAKSWVSVPSLVASTLPMTCGLSAFPGTAPPAPWALACPAPLTGKTPLPVLFTVFAPLGGHCAIMVAALGLVLPSRSGPTCSVEPASPACASVARVMGLLPSMFTTLLPTKPRSPHSLPKPAVLSLQAGSGQDHQGWGVH